MDGRAHERDDFDEAHPFQRYGQEPAADDVAYGDEGRSDIPSSAGTLPHRFTPPAAEPISAVWGEPDADAWLPADPGRVPPPVPAWGDTSQVDYPATTGGQPSYSRLPFGGSPERSEPAPAQPGYNQMPARPAYGSPPAFGAPSGYDPGTDASMPSRRAGYGQDGWTDGRGTDGRGTDGGGFTGLSRDAGSQRDDGGFSRHGQHSLSGDSLSGAIEPATGSILRPDADSTGETRARHGRGELVEVSSRRGRRDRVSDEDDETQGRSRRSMPLWQELPLLLVVAFCLAVLIRTFLLQAFFIPSGSMEQTLLVGDRVLVNKIVYDVRPPERGEVVVFRGTDNWAPENFEEPSSGLIGRIGRTMGDLVGVSRPGEKDFIKRVIGLPGDRVSCCDPSGRVYVNGKGIDEPYVLNNSPLDVPPDPRVCRSRRFDEVLVPPGQIFVMGDHRIVSQDARCQGPVPIDHVIGRAFVIVWPSGRWDTLNVPETFADVPGPVALGPPGKTGTKVRVGAAVVTLPILASLVVTTRSGRKPRWGRRTLRR